MSEALFNLSDIVAPYMKNMLPIAHKNLSAFSRIADSCRLGKKLPVHERCFSGLTACMDFSAHSHRDENNMNGGLTAVS
jgi:hypothetical protein